MSGMVNLFFLKLAHLAPLAVYKHVEVSSVGSKRFLLGLCVKAVAVSNLVLTEIFTCLSHFVRL